ncbi:MAG TPA: hypothetical protein VIJ30_00135 [Candidatus Dormibacteraeota bacterium]
MRTGQGMGSAEFSQVSHFIVEYAERVPIDVAVALLSAWIYDKLKRHKAPEQQRKL